MKLTFKSPKIKAASGDATFSFRVFQGTMRVTIFENSKMMFDRPISDDKWYVVKKLLIKLMNATPGQKLTLIFSAWNSEAKKSEPDWVMTLMKDDRQCFSIAVEWAQGGKYVFPIRGPWNITLGSDPMNDQEQSMLGLEGLIDYVKYTAPVQQVMSNEKEYWDNIRKDSGFGRQSGGGYKGKQQSVKQDADESEYFKGD